MDQVATTDPKFCRVCCRLARAGSDLCDAHNQEVNEQGAFRLQVLTRRFLRRMEDLSAAPCAVGKALVEAAKIHLPSTEDAVRFIAYSADSNATGLLDACGGREKVIDLIAKKPRDAFFCQFCYRPAAGKTSYCSEHHYVDQKKNYRSALRRQSDFLRHLAALELRGFLRQSDNIGVTGLNAHAIQAELIDPPLEGAVKMLHLKRITNYIRRR